MLLFALGTFGAGTGDSPHSVPCPALCSLLFALAMSPSHPRQSKDTDTLKNSLCMKESRDVSIVFTRLAGYGVSWLDRQNGAVSRGRQGWFCAVSIAGKGLPSPRTYFSFHALFLPVALHVPPLASTPLTPLTAIRVLRAAVKIAAHWSRASVPVWPSWAAPACPTS